MKEINLKTRCHEEAALIMKRLDELGEVTDEPGHLTRWFLSPAMDRVVTMVFGWMKEAGLKVSRDGWGNVLGRLPCVEENSRVLLCGSHLDTVRNAGKYDGPLGVLLGVAAARILLEAGAQLPFHLDVAGFSDEEGLRFQATYLGSRALTGRITEADLELRDEHGHRLGDVVDPPDTLPAPYYRQNELLAYLEVHIEQGPVLEAAGYPLGVVTGIAGQTRAKVRMTGRADHTGTCPMNLRKDALPAAAEMVLAAEQLARGTKGLMATVGQIKVEPGASNVVPAVAELTLDVRHLDDGRRSRAISMLEMGAREIAEQRGVGCEWSIVQNGESVPCDLGLREVLFDAAWELSIPVLQLPSGAGHDAAVLSQVAPVGMLFLRSPGGVSHHPDETVLEQDVADALATLVKAIENYAFEDGPAPEPVRERNYIEMPHLEPVEIESLRYSQKVTEEGAEV